MLCKSCLTSEVGDFQSSATIVMEIVASLFKFDNVSKVGWRGRLAGNKKAAHQNLSALTTK